jgi:hypothetical protein
MSSKPTLEHEQEIATLLQLHCALCALPCVPSAEIPSPSINVTLQLNPNNASAQNDWLRNHTTLRMSTGSAQYPTWAGIDLNPPIQVHDYCLAAGLRLQGSAHGWRMLQAWSLPKWTGRMRWSDMSIYARGGIGELLAGLSLSQNPDQQTTPGGIKRSPRMMDIDSRCWKGLIAQQERWQSGKRHYLDVSDFQYPSHGYGEYNSRGTAADHQMDLVSPMSIPPPTPGPSSFDLSIRPRELNSLATLPPHILTQIASYLLDPLDPPKAPNNRLERPPRSPPTQAGAPHQDLQALLNTSSTLRYFDFPHTFWSNLI